MMIDKSETILILGAGLSGLLAGTILSQAGHKVTILEKSRGVGGRMATRRFKDGVFDHGAQFFTVRDPKFQEWVDLWTHKGVVKVWARGFPKATENRGKPGHPRYRGVTGMTSVAKTLSKDLDIYLETRVGSISVEGEGWVARTNDGRNFVANHLILTAPVPQSLSLLEAGEVVLPGRQFEQLQEIQYHPCIAVLALLDGPSAIPVPGGMQVENSPIRWLGDNAQKGISSKATAVTIHASIDFSHRNFDQPPKMLASQLIRIAQPWLGSEVIDWQLHKWRYSQPVRPHSERFLEVPGLPSLFFAGDAFGGPRVEGAALSGMAVASHLVQHSRSQNDE